jgi:hypothetical protein
MRLSPLAVILLTATVGLAADPPKPRVKLLGTVKVDKAVQTVHWSPDAKHLILITADKGLVVGRDQLGEDTPAKPVAEFDLPVGSWTWMGVTPDGAELYVVLTAGSRFNAETRVCFWTLKDLTEGKKKAKPDRIVSLEADNPSEMALGKDGKTFLALTTEPRPNTPLGELPKQRGKVLRVNLKTGDTAEEVATLDDQQATLVGATPDPDSARVFAHFQTDEEHAIRCIDTTTGKKKWERRFDEPAPQGHTMPAPRVSPDGGTLVAFCSKIGQPADPNNRLPPLPGVPQANGQNTVRPHLLNAATGAIIADLGADDVLSADVLGYSADGKVLFGYMSTNTGITRHVLWEAKTGKPLKTWARPSAVYAADFAPGKYELATVESLDDSVRPPVRPLDTPFLLERASAYFPQFQPGLPPPVQVPPAPPASPYRSVVGVWDLAPLVK